MFISSLATTNTSYKLHSELRLRDNKIKSRALITLIPELASLFEKYN